MSIYSICHVPFWRIFIWKIFCKLLTKYLRQSLFSVKSHAFSIFFWSPLKGCVQLWKMFFEEYLILHIKTTFRLQKLPCENFWWNHIRKESSKCYFGNEEHEVMFLVVPRSDVHFSFEQTFFLQTRSDA